MTRSTLHASPPPAVEAPSGKGAADENFPVGSWLLARAVRPHVAAYYAFARAADDVADHPSLLPSDKLARLDALEDGLRGRRGDVAVASRLRTSLAATGVDPRHALDLLDAFRQDVTKGRYADWEELMAYCARSAAPVGRYLLELHAEDKALFALADPLCHALQVLNHLQDCGRDYHELNRVYLPADWLHAAGADVAVLAAPRTSPALRQALDRCLDATEALLDQADALRRQLRSRPLALETAVILGIARRLVLALRHGDPLAGRVTLSRPGYLLAAVSGIARWARPR